MKVGTTKKIFFLSSYLTLALALAPNLLLAQTPAKTSLSTDLTLGGDSVSGRLNEAQIVGVSSSLKFTHQTSENIKLVANGGISLETGSSETVYGVGTYRATNTLFLHQAGLDWRATNWLNLEVGAINQSLHRNPIFITSTPFVSARQNLHFGANGLKAELEMIQAIPSNHTLSQRLGEVDEGSARFFSERLRLSSDQNDYYATVSVGHFAFDRLSSSVAHESRLLGNTVSGEGQLNNQFIYDYQGWNTDLHFVYKGWGPYNLGVSANGIINTAAASDRNRGYRIAPEVGRHFNWGLATLSFEVFRSEADSTVAYYASKFYGNANRQGQASTLTLENSRDDYQLGLRWARAENITATPFQDDETILGLFMRKSYDIL